MTEFLAELANRRRFGMKPGLDGIIRLCTTLGNPQCNLKAIHVAGTNGKGAVCAILDAALSSAGFHTARYTSPHLLSLNERFCLNGQPLSDETLEKYAKTIENALCQRGLSPEITFFEALTAVAFIAFAEAKPDFAILECGLGGRLDATNVCAPAICIITRIGLDHCDWLGDTLEKIANEKAGIIKPDVPVVLGRNEPSVRAVVESKAAALGATFHYAPDLADESEIPADFSLSGSFNRENAVTAIAALKVLFATRQLEKDVLLGFGKAVWPGRFHHIGNFIVDGAHNPPAAEALVAALREDGCKDHSLSLIAGFCSDKDVDRVLSTLAPVVHRAFAVHTGNPRSLSADATVEKMRKSGINAVPCKSLPDAIKAVGNSSSLICGSLFLAGIALGELNAYPWPVKRRDPAELLKV